MLLHQLSQVRKVRIRARPRDFTLKMFINKIITMHHSSAGRCSIDKTVTKDWMHDPGINMDIVVSLPIGCYYSAIQVLILLIRRQQKCTSLHEVSGKNFANWFMNFRELTHRKLASPYATSSYTIFIAFLVGRTYGKRWKTSDLPNRGITRIKFYPLK